MGDTNKISLTSRVVAGCVLVIVLCVFFLGEVLLARTYRFADGNPFPSPRDAEIVFVQGSKSLLEARVRTDMRAYLSESEYTTMVTWLRSGSPESVYRSDVAGILDSNCVSCHSKDGIAGFRTLATYEAVKAVATSPPAPPMGAMITITKLHLLGIGALLLAPALISSRSRWISDRARAACVVLAFGGLLVDFGGWWLMRWVVQASWIRAIGHVAFLIGTASLLLASFEALRHSEGPG